MRVRWTCGVLAMLLLGTAWGSPGEDYVLYCMGCHGAQAQGVPGRIPPLAHALAFYMRSPAGRNYVLRVPGAASSVLSDAQLAAVLNWLADRYSAEELAAQPVPPFTVEEVAQARHTPLPDVLATRRDVVRALSAGGASLSVDY